jgi:hypothetical protein
MVPHDVIANELDDDRGFTTESQRAQRRKSKGNE